MVNTESFVLLAGNPKEWDSEFEALRDRIKKMEQRGGPDDNLLQIQESQWARGHRIAELCDSAFGWCVRSAFGFDEWKRYSPFFPSRDEAIQWGEDWANDAPEFHEFIARKHLLK